MCPGKERRSSNYSRNAGRLQEKGKNSNQRKKEKLSKECQNDLG